MIEKPSEDEKRAIEQLQSGKHGIAFELFNGWLKRSLAKTDEFNRREKRTPELHMGQGSAQTLEDILKISDAAAP